MRGARQEAACRAERVELARPGIGPLAPGAAHPVEARPQGLELGKQRVEQSRPPLLQQPVRLIDGGATLGIGRHGSLDGSVGARVHADPLPARAISWPRRAASRTSCQADCRAGSSRSQKDVPADVGSTRGPAQPAAWS